MTDSLEDLVGETLMVGLSGPTPSAEDLRTLEETRAAGVILYRRNFEDPGQLLRLLERLDAAAGKRLLVATDHEGGRVVMLGQGTTIFPDNLAMGRGGDATDAARQGELEGRELRRLGVDLNLAPTLDVLQRERYSPNIGIRAYGEDPARVAELGAARIRAMQQQGVAACAKHFPGKGHSPLDAHLRLAVIDSTEEDMRARHLPPFVAAIAGGGVECVMTSHPIYPALDPDRVPATFSRRIVTGLLRDELGFEGVIVSDDLEMGAVSEVCSVGLDARGLVVASRGVWTPAERRAAAAPLVGLAPRVAVIPDVEAAFLAALGPAGPGLLLLAGTGSIALGRTARGAWVRAGGLGPLLGDEGSGFWIGREWLRAHASPARARGLSRRPDAVARIAALARGVVARARRGGRAERAVVRAAQVHLARLAAGLAAELDVDAALPAAYAGAVLGDAWFRAGVTRAAARAGVRLRWQPPADAALAAARLAERSLG